ncbi:MAG: hypothetical protein HS115_07350 [Spirochaetales bacterium]|nr:hypothetical protein [Spirochaetales bacterium]
MLLRFLFCLFLVSYQALQACEKDYYGTPLELSGSWYTQKGNLQGQNPDLSVHNWQKLELPSAWKKHGFLKGHSGTVFYRCHIHLRSEAPVAVALYLGVVREADTVYFNGEEIGQTAMNPQSVDIEKVRIYSIPEQLWKKGLNVIAVKVQGTVNDAGILGVPRIGPERELRRSTILRDVPVIIASFTYILVAAFFFLFTVFFWEQRENLFFALFALTLGLYNLIRSWMRYELFDSFVTSFQVELVLIIILPALFINYLVHLLKINYHPLIWGYHAYAGLLLLVTLFARTTRQWNYIIDLNLAAIAFALILALWIIRQYYHSHRDKLYYVVMGMLSLVPAILYDMLVTFLSLPWPRLTVYFFAVFLTFIALQLADSILGLYRAMQEQEKGLVELERKKTRSIFHFSNEFRILLEGLMAGVTALEQGKKGGSGPVRLESSLHNLNNIVNESNLMRLLEQKDYADRNVRFSVQNLVKEQIESALLGTGAGKSRLQAILPENDFEILGDPDLYGMALYHLIENALLYSTGRVEVIVSNDDGRTRFDVVDEGPGLPPEQQALIFQKFVRGPDEQEKPGIGIGLTLVELIARHLRGKVELRSAPGFHSVFSFVVPGRAS